MLRVVVCGVYCWLLVVYWRVMCVTDKWMDRLVRGCVWWCVVCGCVSLCAAVRGGTIVFGHALCVVVFRHVWSCMVVDLCGCVLCLARLCLVGVVVCGYVWLCMWLCVVVYYGWLCCVWLQWLCVVIYVVVC